MPEDGKRYEAIDGNVYVTPSPSLRHQRVAHKLALALHPILEEPGHGVLVPDFDIEFPETGEGVRPDLIFVSEERGHLLEQDAFRGGPDLVVEILSPSTAERDRGLKRKLYQRQGVAEYWVVDPEAREVLVWRFGMGILDPEPYREALPVYAGGRVVGHVDVESLFFDG